MSIRDEIDNITCKGCIEYDACEFTGFSPICGRLSDKILKIFSEDLENRARDILMVTPSLMFANDVTKDPRTAFDIALELIQISKEYKDE